MKLWSVSVLIVWKGPSRDYVYNGVIYKESIKVFELFASFDYNLTRIILVESPHTNVSTL